MSLSGNVRVFAKAQSWWEIRELSARSGSRTHVATIEVLANFIQSSRREHALGNARIPSAPPYNSSPSGSSCSPILIADDNVDAANTLAELLRVLWPQSVSCLSR
jgi:hypothetical protein